MTSVNSCWLAHLHAHTTRLISSLSVPLFGFHPGSSLTCALRSVQVVADGKEIRRDTCSYVNTCSCQVSLTTSISAGAPVLTAARGNELICMTEQRVANDWRLW